jgi:chromosome segregation ATPase
LIVLVSKRFPSPMTLPAALFEWMNTFPDVKALGANSLSDFRDGFAIAHVWNAIATPRIDPTTLAKPRDSKDWISFLRNLRAIDQILAPAYAQRGFRERPDITGLARRGEPDDMAKFIQPLLAIAVQSENKTEILNRIKTLSVASQTALKGTLEAFSGAEKSEEGGQIGSEIAAVKKKIEEFEMELREIGKARPATAGAEEAELLGRTKEALAEVERESEDLKERLVKARAAKEKVRVEYAAAKRRHTDSVQRARQQESEAVAKKEATESIALIESSLLQYQELESELTEWRQKTKALEVEVGSVEEEVRALKDEITTSVQLAEKYGAAGLEGVVPAENEAKETVPELANRISQLEVEIAVLKDSLESGQSGIPTDLSKEQDELKKTISRLLKRKKALDAASVKKRQLREEMQRVQKLMVDQREEVERELEKLAEEINVRNVELTNWLSFSSSFEALGQSPTFISELRQKYL